MANPQMGLATFVGMQIEKDTTHHQRAVRVVPLNDGRWFCPDCGHLNQKFDTYCLGCGREIS